MTTPGSRSTRGPVYLDWNATTPPHPRVLHAMDEARESGWGNPASVHAAGRAARRYQEDARELLGKLLGLSPRDIVFSGGGTEANHLALSGATSIFLSRLEHASLVGMAEFQAEHGRASAHFVEAEPSGVVSVASLHEELERSKAAGTLGTRPVIAVQAANQETGAIQPLERARELASAYGCHLHVDAVQLIGRGDLGPLAVADSVTVSAHKIRGPKGVGALAAVCGWSPKPLGRGGSQERGLRAGTLDGVALAGLRAALLRIEESTENYRSVRRLRDSFEHTLGTIEGAVIHGANGPRLAHVSNFRIAGFSGDELVAALDLEGVCVSSGSACSAGSSEPSSVIRAMLGIEAARGAVRVSFGEDSSESDLEALIGALKRVGALR